MNQEALSADTEVVLLLCGRFGGERSERYPPLSAKEYGELAKWLNDRDLRPADLLPDMDRHRRPLMQEVKLDPKRIEFLLGRGTALALALERWNRAGIWVISRGDDVFPKRLKRRLRHAAPPLLYGAGDKRLLDTGGLAIVGSRNATEDALEFTREIAARCARDQISVVSGGARGVDAAGMQGATGAGGVCVGVLASDLVKACVNRQNRIGLQEKQLVLVSPFYPEAGFNAGNAMGRNKYIYALADHALVVDSALGSGGTWEGAVENLQQEWVPLFVRVPGDGAGNAALVARGGIAFQFKADCDEALAGYLVNASPLSAHSAEPEAAQRPLLVAKEELAEFEFPAVPPLDDPAQIQGRFGQVPLAAESLDMYLDFVTKLLRVLADGPLGETEVAAALSIEKAQAKVWLRRAAETGAVEKLKRPVRYAVRAQSMLC